MGTVQDRYNGSRRALTTGIVALALALMITGCGIFGGKDRDDIKRERMLASETVTSIGINAYLWRASLETLDFMPMLQADPESGVIITDWYVNPSSRNERAKVTVYVLDKTLRADALKVSVFKQTMRNGAWADNPDTLAAEQELENAILVQARRIRLEQVPIKE